jgi:hypothetical protein
LVLPFFSVMCHFVGMDRTGQNEMYCCSMYEGYPEILGLR